MSSFTSASFPLRGGQPRAASPHDSPCGSQRKRHLRVQRAGSEALLALADGSLVASTSDTLMKGLASSRHVTIQLAPSGSILCLLYERSLHRETVTLVYEGSNLSDAVESANATLASLRSEGYSSPASSRRQWLSERDVVHFLHETARSASPFARAAGTCLARTRSGPSRDCLA